MDLEQEGSDGDPCERSHSLVRLIATMDGHTHVYQFPPEQSHRAATMIKLHVEEGALHPYAGVMLLRMLRENNA
jgi:hypothetical protein